MKKQNMKKVDKLKKYLFNNIGLDLTEIQKRLVKIEIDKIFKEEKEQEKN